MPKEQYLSFNLVSLYEAISLHVSDKMNTGHSNGVANGNTRRSFLPPGDEATVAHASCLDDACTVDCRIVTYS